MGDLSRSRRARSAFLHGRVLSVLRSGVYLSGPQTLELETRMSQFVGASHAVAVSSGTSALQLALLAAQRRKPGVVVATPNAGAYSTIAARQAGVPIHYCDIDSRTHLISPDSLEPMMHAGVSAVIATHLYGNVIDLEPIRQVAEAHGAVVIEDAAQALGGVRHEQRVGSMGWAAAHSFFPTKNVGGIGDGGAVTTSSEEAAYLVKSLRQYGWADKYIIKELGGSNHRIDEVNACVISAELDFVQHDIEIRLATVRLYGKAVEGSGLRLVTLPTEGNTAHLCVVEFPSERSRDACRRFLDDQGVDSDVHYPRPDVSQIPLQSTMRTMRQPRLPGAIRACATVLSVPCFAEMTGVEQERVATALAVFSRRGLDN